MKSYPEHIVKQINQVYYLVYSATILSTLIGYFLTMNRNPESIPDVKSELSIGISSFIIAYILISIPLALSLFHKNVKKWKENPDIYEKCKQYIHGAQLRLGAVGLGLIISIIGHFILFAGTPKYSLIFCAAIAAIALFFCKPNASKVATELGIETNENDK